MHQIVRGTTELVELEIFTQGEPSSADGNVVVSVTDADYYTEVGSGGNATATSIPGKYTFKLDPSYTSLNRVLKVRWDYTIDGTPTYSEDFLEVFTPYASVSQIIDHYEFGTRPQDLNYISHKEIVAAERVARYQVDSYTGQSFGRLWGDQEVFGYDSDAIQLNERMLSISKLYANGELVIDYTQNPSVNSFGCDIELTTTHKAIRIVNPGYSVIYEGQMNPVVLSPGKFRNNTRYKVYGEFGWAYVPQDIQYCTIKLVGNILSKDAQWREKYLKKIDLSEISFEMAGGAFTGTGDVIVDAILDNYRDTGIVII